MSAILAAYPWHSNAELIEACATLKYLKKEWTTIDPTYGAGAWWNEWQPNILVTHDLKIDGVDFTDLPYEDGAFDAGVFDPPYICIGGRGKSDMSAMYERYGLKDAPATPNGLQFLINDGLIEVGRVVKPRGFVLVKCADYISSGKFFPGTHFTAQCALANGFEWIDRFEYVVDTPRPQPKGRKQKHARRNLSTLMVFRAPKVSPEKPKLAEGELADQLAA